MPGITSKNIHSVMNQVNSIAELVTLSLERLTLILGNTGSAEQLFTFIHTDGNDASTAAAASVPSKQGGASARMIRPRHKRLPLKKPSAGKNV